MKQKALYKSLGKLEVKPEALEELGDFTIFPLKKNPYRVRHYEAAALPPAVTQGLLEMLGVEWRNPYPVSARRIELLPAWCIMPYRVSMPSEATLLYQVSGDIKVRTGNSRERSQPSHIHLMTDSEVGIVQGVGRRSIENAGAVNSQTVLLELPGVVLGTVAPHEIQTTLAQSQEV